MSLRVLSEGPWWVQAPDGTIKCLLCRGSFTTEQYALQHAKIGKHIDARKFALAEDLWEFASEGWVCKKCPPPSLPLTFAQAKFHASEAHPSAETLQAVCAELGATWIISGGKLVCVACAHQEFTARYARMHNKHPTHLRNAELLRSNKKLNAFSALDDIFADDLECLEPLRDDKAQPRNRAPRNGAPCNGAPRNGAPDSNAPGVASETQPPFTKFEDMRLLFWQSSPLSLQQDRAVPPPVSVETKKELLEDFQNSYDINATPFNCACCGRLQFGEYKVEVPHELLSADASTLGKLSRISKEARDTYNIVTYLDRDYHLVAEGMTESGLMRYCLGCWGDLENGRIPRWCLKSGFDFGRTAGLPNLTLPERILISRVRHYNTIVKLKGFSCDLKYSGHYISFPHDGPRSATKLPRRDGAETIQVVFVGTRGEFENGKAAFQDLMCVRRGPVLEWLKILCEINEFYSGVVIDTEFDPSGFTEALIDNAVIADSKTAMRLEGMTVAVANTGREEGMGHVLVTPKTADVEGLDALQGLMAATRKALPKADAEAAADRERRLDAEEGASRPIRVHQERIPLVEFAQNHYIIGGGFPCLFMGFNWGVLRTQEAALSKCFVKHAVEWGDGRFARDAIWAFVTFNQIQRHALVQQVASMIRPGSNTPLSATVRELESQEFWEKLSAAIKNPDAKESLRLQKKLLRTIKTCASKVPWSDMERRSCFPRMISMYQYGGMPSIFYTISPADMDQPQMLRLSLYATHGDTYLAGANFPPDIAARTMLYKQNPAYCAMTFDKLVRTIIRCLFRVDASGRDEKSTKPLQIGIFSRAFMNFGVVEAQGRGSLHIHGLLWTEIEPRLLEKAAGSDLEQSVARLLDSVCRTMLDEQFSPPTEPCRGALLRSPLPGTASFDHRVSDLVHTVQTHTDHSDTCWKNGESCRFGIPNELCQNTGAYHLFDNGSKVEAIHPCVAREETTYTEVGYEVDKTLPILWRTARPKAADANVVGYNDVLTAATGSNTAIVILGAMVMAVAVMFYLLKYLTKPPTGIASAASCLHEALERQKQAVTKGVPTPTEGSEKTRSFLNKFACRYLAKMEMSGQQTFSCILRHPASYESHSFAYCSINQAVKMRLGVEPVHDESEDEVMRDEFDEEDDAECADGGDAAEDGASAVELDEDEASSGSDVADSTSDSESEDQDEDEPVSFEVTKERQIALRQQEVNYRWRGPQLQHLSLYEYTAIVGVTLAKEEKEKKRGAGRKLNALVAFESEHPRSATHVQQLRSKALIPILAGKGPPRITGKLMSRYLHAKYMSTLFVPWGGKDIAFRNPVKTWSLWLQRMRTGNNIDVALFRCAQNIAHPMENRSSTAVRLLVNRFRFQCADKRSQVKTSAGGENTVGDEDAEKALNDIQVAMGSEDDPSAAYVSDLRDHLKDLSDERLNRPHAAMTYPVDQSIVRKLFQCQKFASHEERIHSLSNAVPKPITSDPKGCVSAKFTEPKHADQLRAFNHLFEALNHPNPPQKLFLLMGGPGCGKTVVCQELAVFCPQLLCTSTTASTAKKIHPRARTYQSALGTEKKCEKTIAECLLAFRQSKIRGLLVDEVSMLGCNSNSIIDERCRRITGKTTERYGGLIVIFVGDFHQLPCVKDRPLYSDAFALENFEFMELTIDIRADGDKLQQKIVKELREPELCREALKLYLKTVKELSGDDEDFLDSAPFLVCTNSERCALTLELAPRFAEKRGLKCLRFPLRANANFKGTAKDFEGYQLFVVGAPANIVENDYKVSGLLNGFSANFHSISYASQQDLKIAKKALTESSGVIVDVPRPSTVNVVYKDPKYKETPGYHGAVYCLSERQRVQNTDPFVEFMAVPAFAITLHKAQGFTLHKGVLQLSDRPRTKKGSCGRLTMESVYVAISRAESTADTRMFPSLGSGFQQLLTLKPNAKVVAWYANARSTGCCTAPQILKKTTKGKASGKVSAPKAPTGKAALGQKSTPTVGKTALGSMNTPTVGQTAPGSMNTPTVRQTALGSMNTPTVGQTALQSVNTPTVALGSINTPTVRQTAFGSMNTPTVGQTALGSMNTPTVGHAALQVRAIHRLEAAGLYMGTVNPGSGCYCISFVAALSCVASERSCIADVIRNDCFANSITARTACGEDIARHHGVDLDALKMANVEVFESGSIFGKIITIPHSEMSTIACLRRLCLLQPSAEANHDTWDELKRIGINGKKLQKTRDLIRIASTNKWPPPSTTAEHQCAEELITFIHEVIPVWRDITEFNEERFYTCPMCKNTVRESNMTRKFVVYTGDVKSECFDMAKFSECVEPAHNVEPWRCGECNNIIRVDRRVSRTTPDILCVVVHRLGTNQNMRMPRTHGSLILNSVICHVHGGTHYVTKMLSLGALADDSSILPLNVDEAEPYGYQHDFIHFYINGREGSTRDKRERERACIVSPRELQLREAPEASAKKPKVSCEELPLGRFEFEAYVPSTANPYQVTEQEDSCGLDRDDRVDWGDTHSSETGDSDRESRDFRRYFD